MFLSAQSIRERCLVGAPSLESTGHVQAPLISPFVERTVHECGMSFGLSACSYDVRIAENLHVPMDGQLVLASTVERFYLPDDLAMEIKDKSSLVRRGLTVQNTHADPGWRGWLTLELVNHSRRPMFLVAGQPVAQVIFVRLDQPTSQPYEGKYQDQERGPQVSRREPGGVSPVQEGDVRSDWGLTHRVLRGMRKPLFSEGGLVSYPCDVEPRE